MTAAEEQALKAHEEFHRDQHRDLTAQADYFVNLIPQEEIESFVFDQSIAEVHALLSMIGERLARRAWAVHAAHYPNAKF